MSASWLVHCRAMAEACARAAIRASRSADKPPAETAQTTWRCSAHRRNTTNWTIPPLVVFQFHWMNRASSMPFNANLGHQELRDWGIGGPLFLAVLEDP
ncbi:hypothetical protein Q31a_44570 [Aureliella helgolandensis]|uniref:Uncharacterized protein n=1 Tax=Aureliella helgolandensis TaxID=2527968 RepID=A0A518GBT3_9BACT|nr:hypothetical protein Q31a_44570 [Aureliella helgolandensis]